MVNATDSIELSGTSANGQFSSGLFSLTTGAGRAGNLRMETGDLRIQDGAQSQHPHWEQDEAVMLE